MSGAQRFFLTLAAVLATTLMSIDIMIASVALPQMQGSLSVTADQVSWVLTSYVIAMAVTTPVVGPFAARVGQRRAFLIGVGGFTLTSLLCGLAWSLETLVLFRLLQGISAAALVPISQTVLLDSYPPARQGEAMAYWTTGVMVGPIVGPALGGWLTDLLSWSWIFYVNLPFGVLAFACIAAFMPRDEAARAPKPFDVTGFVLLALALGSLQFILERGERLDWFESALIVGLALLAAGTGWMFAVHSRFAAHPFIPRELFRDRNFVACLVVTTVTSGAFMANISMLAPMLQNVLGYPAREAGFMVGPRGLGVVAGILLSNAIRHRVSNRTVIAVGVVASAASIWWISTFSLEVDPQWILTVGITQGFFYGIVFVPLTTATFATLEPSLRTDGASLVQLLRQLAGGATIALGFSWMIRRTHGQEQELAARLNADADRWTSLLEDQGGQGIALLEKVIGQQAAMLSYIEVMHVLALALLLTMPLVLVLRPGQVDSTVKKEETIGPMTAPPSE
jgi:DHA2 family multidrug resistance protein